MGVGDYTGGSLHYITLHYITLHYITPGDHYSQPPTLLEHPHPLLPLPVKPRNFPISSSSFVFFPKSYVWNFPACNKVPEGWHKRWQAQCRLMLHVCKKIPPEKTQSSLSCLSSWAALLRHRGTPNGCPCIRAGGEGGRSIRRKCGSWNLVWRRAMPSSVGELLLPSPAVILDGQNSCDGSPMP